MTRPHMMYLRDMGQISLMMNWTTCRHMTATTMTNTVTPASWVHVMLDVGDFNRSIISDNIGGTPGCGGAYDAARDCAPNTVSTRAKLSQPTRTWVCAAADDGVIVNWMLPA